MLRAFPLGRFRDNLLSYSDFFSCFSSYGFLNRFHSEPLMPNQVYHFDSDPVTRRVRAVATDPNRCNGIVLSEDGKLAYMYVLFPFFQSLQFLIFGLTTSRLRTIRTDTAAAGEFLGNNQTEPATMQVLTLLLIFFLVYLNLTTTSPSPLPFVKYTDTHSMWIPIAKPS